MKLVNLTLCLLLASSTIYAKSSSDNNSTKADVKSKSSLNSSDKDAYMPAIITPEELKSGVYGGMGFSTGFLNATGIEKKSLLDISLVAGYNINEYLAAESRVLVSIAYGDGLDYQNMSLFLKPKYEAYDGLNIYSLVGFGKVKVNSINSEDTKSSKTSMQYGLGVDYKMENNFKLFADYTFLGKDSNAKYKGSNAILKSGALTTGITYDF